MKIAFSGAAGIGKTTTARVLADKLNVPFLAEDFGAYFEAATRLRAGSQPGISEGEQTAASRHYLHTAQEWLNNRAQQFRNPDGFVADRWALDMLTAFLSKGVFRHENELVEQLIRHTQQQAAQLDLLVFLPLTTEWVTEVNESALPRPRRLSTQLMMHSLCRGLHIQLTGAPVLHVPKRIATVEDRVQFIMQALERSRQAATKNAARESL